VLHLAAIEFIFFAVASIGLCFTFVLKTVLISQGWFSHCWAVLTESQGLFCFSPHPTSKEVGGVQEVGRGCNWNSWPPLTKGTLHTIQCHAQHIKWGEEEGREGHLELWCLSSQGTVNAWCSPALLEMAEHLSANGKWWISFILCVSCV